MKSKLNNLIPNWRKKIKKICPIKKNGIGIIYISHKLKEIIYVSDRITVLKDGKINDSFLKQQVNEEDLIKSMIGENVLIKNEQQNKTYSETPILELKNFNYSNIFKNINIELFYNYFHTMVLVQGLATPRASIYLSCSIYIWKLILLYCIINRWLMF